MILFQGFHEFEHVVQILQRFTLNIPNGNGIVGQAVDAAASFKLFAIEPLWTLTQFLKERGREEEAAPYEARWAELSPTMVKRAARIA